MNVFFIILFSSAIVIGFILNRYSFRGFKELFRSVSYGVDFVDMNTITNCDAVVLAVAHDEFAKLTMAEVDKLFGEGQKVLLDIKGLLNRKEYENAGYSYWRL